MEFSIRCTLICRPYDFLLILCCCIERYIAAMPEGAVSRCVIRHELVSLMYWLCHSTLTLQMSNGPDGVVRFLYSDP
jgi:hypothetical protein